MNSMLLCILCLLIHCTLSSRKTWANSKYNYPKKKQYEKVKKWPSSKPTDEPTANPTEYPTVDPTPFPTFNECPSKLMDPSSNPIEYVFVVDNSCGLTQSECRVQMEEIGSTLRQIKVEKGRYFATKVGYVEFYEKGAKTLIGFEDDKYQKDAEKYYDFIVDQADCGKGGNGKSDTVAGLKYAIDEFVRNGDDDKETARKIIMFNNCEMTGYEYDDDDDAELFEDVVNELKETDNFLNAPDLMIINVPSQDKPSKNAISEPYDYLAFLIGENSSKMPSPSQLYVAPPKYLNDHQVTPEDFTAAALVENGRIVDRNDVYRDDQRICRVLNKPNTELPTAQPTEYPTSYPTEIPTADPTEPQKVCFKIDQKVSKMKNMRNRKHGNNKMECQSSWSLYKEGTKRAVDSGDFKGYKDTKCVYIEYGSFDYTVSVKRACGKVSWSVDGEECGYYDFDKSPNMAKEFPLKCSKFRKFSKW